MFRVVVIVGIAAAPIIAVGLIAGPEWGALLLALEVGIGIGVLWRSSRGTEPHTAAVATADDDAHRVLVVANQTVAGQALLEEIKRRCAGRRNEVFVVVPALPGSRLEHLAHDVDAAIDEAQARLQRSLEAMRAAGIDASGQVGDHHDPNVAIEDALREFAADEVVISTHPPERSKWLERGVVERAEREVPLPVAHVVVDLEAEGAPAGTA
jgi:GABA permease